MAKIYEKMKILPYHVFEYFQLLTIKSSAICSLQYTALRSLHNLLYAVFPYTQNIVRFQVDVCQVKLVCIFPYIVRANLKSKGLFFVFGEELQKTFRTCLIELLNDVHLDVDSANSEWIFSSSVFIMCFPFEGLQDRELLVKEQKARAKYCRT